MTSTTFAFLVHPRVHLRQDFGGWFAPLGILPEPFYAWSLRTLPFPPVTAGTITLRDRPGTPAGLIMMVPLGARQMLELPRDQVVQRVDAAVDHAVRRGAQVVGLGALTASVTAGGQRLAQRTDVALTNGNAFTAVMIAQAAQQLIGRDSHADPTIAIVGASGSVGTTATRLIARQRSAARLILIGRTPAHLEERAAVVRAEAPGLKVQISRDIADARTADLVIVLTSSADSLLRAAHLKPGAIVLDGTQPRNTDRALPMERPDVQVLDGGLAALTGVRIGVNLGLPRGCAYACLAETMLLALEGHTGHFSIGAPTIEQAEYIGQLARKYRQFGFTLAPWHSFGQPVIGRQAAQGAELAMLGGE
jgi:fatty aldehyde-generating acyl-ACP reductase